MSGLRALFEPRAVAVVGVSRNRHGLGRRIFENLRASGYKGRVFPVTRDGGEVDGISTWPTVGQIQAPVDLAVIAVERDAVPGVVDECIAAGVKAVVVISAGFAEAGPDGRALQDSVLAKVRAAGVRLVGPNCMGVMNADPARPMNASFVARFPPAGGLALSSQSGALGLVILDLADRRHVGLSTFASVGNKSDVSGNDLLQYWADDPATQVIALYLESFGNPRRFAQIAKSVARRKPIIAVKSGRTRAGAAAAGSHTAALATSDVAVSALFHQTGVIRADTIDEMFDLAACLQAQPLPRGNRIAIVTNAGGPGILAADACAAAGLDVVPFTPDTTAALRAALPSLPAIANPLDMIATAGPDQYRAAIAASLAAEEIDALLVLYTSVDPATAAAVTDGIRAGIVDGRARGGRRKPIVACLMADELHPQLTAGAETIPVYDFPENAIRALGKIHRYAAWRSTPRPSRDLGPVQSDEARAICTGALTARGGDWLTQEESWRLLACYGIALTPSLTVRSGDDAVSTAHAIGFPVVAKLHSRQAVHKTEVGGVLVNLRNADDVRAAFDRLTARGRELGLGDASVSIEPMVAGGIETVIGIARDPSFGSLVGFGLGGVDVEALDDMRFRITPLDDVDIDEMIRESRAFRLMQARRGRAAADIAAVADLLTRVSRLAADIPDIAELDLNPVMVMAEGHGCQIVDVRIRMGARGPGC